MADYAQPGASAMNKYLLAFLRDETGVPMAEYAVAGGLVTLAAVARVTGFICC
jgi:Flp pilus assembly pilin Flp